MSFVVNTQTHAENLTLTDLELASHILILYFMCYIRLLGLFSPSAELITGLFVTGSKLSVTAMHLGFNVFYNLASICISTGVHHRLYSIIRD